MGDRLAGLFTAAAFAAILPWSAAAQDFPANKPIEMTVMFGAGSAADVTARHLAEGIAKRLGVAVPVVNRTGGGGAAGYIHVSQQQSDGHAIIWTANSISTTYHMGTLPLSYTSFEPVARVSVEIPALAVKADAPWKTLGEFIEDAKKNPGKFRIGNSGTASFTHLVSAALFTPLGAKVTDVPFGQGQALANLLGGRIEAAIQLPAAFVSHVKSGELRILAMLGTARDPLFPDAPSATELGYNVALDMWRGVAVPKGTPPSVVAKLQDAIKETVESPEFKKAGETIGFTPAYLAADEFGKIIARDDKALADLIGSLGMKKSQ